MEANIAVGPSHERRPTAKVQFARLIALNLAIADFSEAVGTALVPGTAVDRYGRDWRMGQYEEDRGYVYGRIGFQAAGVTELWNEQKMDFEERELPAGTTSPFAIRLADGELAFQRRPGVIEPTSFTGALQALLNEASDYTRWRVVRESRPIGWDDWVASVDRVVELRLRLERPNPNYKGRDKVEELIEGTNARLADLALRAGGDDDDVEGLDLNDDIVAQAIDHAEEYGSYRATGERRGEPPIVWRSDEEIAPERTIEADPETKEARPERLRDELEEREPVDDGDD